MQHDLPANCPTSLADFQTTGSLANPNFATAAASEQHTSAGNIGTFMHQVASLQKLLGGIHSLRLTTMSTCKHQVQQTTQYNQDIAGRLGSGLRRGPHHFQHIMQPR